MGGVVGSGRDMSSTTSRVRIGPYRIRLLGGEAGTTGPSRRRPGGEQQILRRPSF